MDRKEVVETLRTGAMNMLSTTGNDGHRKHVLEHAMQQGLAILLEQIDKPVHATALRVEISGPDGHATLGPLVRNDARHGKEAYDGEGVLRLWTIETDLLEGIVAGIVKGFTPAADKYDREEALQGDLNDARDLLHGALGDLADLRQLVDEAKPVIGLVLGAIRAAEPLGTGRLTEKKWAKVRNRDIDALTDALHALCELPADDDLLEVLTPAGCAQQVLAKLFGEVIRPPRPFKIDINDAVEEMHHVLGDRGALLGFTSGWRTMQSASERCASSGGHYWRPSKATGAFCTSCGLHLPHARFD